MKKIDLADKFFNGRRGILATMHQKEAAISPILKKELGLEMVLPDQFDTDIFGTFTGEVKRMGDQLEAGLPLHGMILRTKDLHEASKIIIKGITTKEGLQDAFDKVRSCSGDKEVVIETDMRAMFNPTRMKAITEATYDLVQKIRRSCPNCSQPGFALVERVPGLPCGWCGLATAVTSSHVYRCRKCQTTEEILYPDGKEKADPGQCQFCNP